MSGHSKWSKVKHQKATTDVVKARAFTRASHVIMIAVREGGGIGNPEMNFRLRLAIEKAKDVNMPKENIERAIAKGKGEGGVAIVQVLYEAYGPSGVAMMIEATTDNKVRTVSAIKNILDRHGGVLASPGAVGYLFKRVGLLLITKAPGMSFDTVLEKALEAGADDVVERDDVFEIFTDPTALMNSKQVLEKQFTIEQTEFIMHPSAIVEIPIERMAAIDKLLEALEEQEDVVKVYTNT